MCWCRVWLFIERSWLWNRRKVKMTVTSGCRHSLCDAQCWKVRGLSQASDVAEVFHLKPSLVARRSLHSSNGRGSHLYKSCNCALHHIPTCTAEWYNLLL